MRELTLEEMRMVTGGLARQDMFDDRILRDMERKGQYGFDAKTPIGGGGGDAKGDAAKAIGNFFGDVLGALGAVGCAATKGLGKQVGCAIAADKIAEASKPIATAAADGVLRGGGQPGDYACAKLGICR